MESQSDAILCLRVRAILTLKNMARSMLTAAKKSNRYWGAALMHAGYLRCRSPHTALQGKTPYEMVHDGKPPEIAHLRTFGCDAFPHVHTERQARESKAKKGTYIGYNDQNQSHIIAFDDVGSNSVNSILSCPSKGAPL